MTLSDELYNVQLVRYYRAMGYYGVKVQPFEVFRDAYVFAGGYSYNWQLRRLVDRYARDSLDAVLIDLYRVGWRATVFAPRINDVCFTYTGYDDEDSD